MNVPATAEDLCFTPAVQLAGLIRRKELSPVEVADAFLQRIDALNPKLNAYVTLYPERTRAAAKQAGRALAAGSDAPLLGVPFSIKDLAWQKGVRTTFGSRACESFVPDEDDPIVARMLAAGGVPLGKTNTPEFGWLAITDNEVFGVTHNPWRLGYTPSGSSGGAAAACAAGLSPISLGSDGGGSIRHPASFCGVFGIKPTFGVVPKNHRSDGWFSLSHQGPITRTVADGALAMDVLAGFEPRDLFSAPLPPQRFAAELDRDLNGLRVAYTPDFGTAQVDPVVRRAFEVALPAFEEFGCELTAASPDMREAREIFKWVMFGELVGADLKHFRPDGTSDLSPPLHQFVSKRKDILVRDYMTGMEKRRMMAARVQEFFREYDLLLTPTMAIPPFRHPKDLGEYPHTVNGVEVGSQGWHPFTFPFNLTTNPAATVPCGFTDDGLPLGLQIVGRRFEDLLVVQAAAAFEGARPWADKRPPIA
jgi:aspartyl-tRNA(Asn)/glutamyl-tRNA(Gln) amidotransferase subunit A